jgi:hypothetical protein
VRVTEYPSRSSAAAITRGGTVETAAHRSLAGMDVHKKMLAGNGTPGAGRTTRIREAEVRHDPEGDGASGGLAATEAGRRGGHGIHRPGLATSVVRVGSAFPAAPDPPAQDASTPRAQRGLPGCPTAGGPLVQRGSGREFRCGGGAKAMAVADAEAGAVEAADRGSPQPGGRVVRAGRD